MDNAARGGHFEMLKWLHENRTEGYTHAAMDDAAAYGHLDIVKWLHRHRAQCTTLAMDDAADGNHLRVLRWLFENRRKDFPATLQRTVPSLKRCSSCTTSRNKGLQRKLRSWMPTSRMPGFMTIINSARICCSRKSFEVQS
ncbi:hypothetical protein V7S43_011681 [Phytophthora oleae]|uniref:Ankyrin repeat protein n=1 Tax=Phytophthora oleae TaxID=2107226 RepID=A0ABD3F8V2_9STRA